MKWTIGKTEEQCFVRVTLEGEFSTDEFSEIFGDLFAREYWQLGMHILFDESKLSLCDIDYQIIRHTSECYAKHFYHIGDGKIALLMKSLSDYGRGRQFELLTEMKIPTSICIFMVEEEAISWLTDKSTSLSNKNL